jgi:hypothetical protein
MINYSIFATNIARNVARIIIRSIGINRTNIARTIARNVSIFFNPVHH